MIKRKGFIKRGNLVRKSIKRAARSLGNPSRIVSKRRRRKKGEITKLKEKLWQLCREIQITRYGRICYTCGKTVEKNKGLHLGHYITSSLCSVPLRFDLRNLRPQCYHCNINLSGNWPTYKYNIEAEVGPNITPDLLEFNQQTKGKVYPVEWFQEKITEYETLIKELS